MSSDWITKTIGEVSINLDKKRKPIKATERKSGPFPYYGASGIVDYVDSYLFDGEYLLVAEDGENLKTLNTPIAFSARGKFWVNNHAHILKGKEEVLTDFIRFWLLSNSISGYLSGAVMPKLTQAALNSIPITFPDKSIQKKIVRVLTCLEHTVEILKEQNTTLEALAQTLFRSWFVNFDPVHAKAAGQTPEGMSPELAALFPSEFVESELGMIPKGWKIAHFSDLAQRAKKSINPGNLPDVTFTHFSIPAFDSKGMPNEELGSAIMSNKTSIETPAVLQSKLNPHKPRIWRISKPEKNYVCSTEFLAWSALNPCETHFLDSLLRSDFFIGKTLELVSGTSNSHQRAKPGDIESVKLILPQSELREKYSLLVSTLNNSIDTNIATVKVLAQLRDELLPRLISGKLRIEEAEEAVAEVLRSTAEKEKAA